MLINEEFCEVPFYRVFFSQLFGFGQQVFEQRMSRHGREKQKQFLRYFNHLLGQAIKIQVLQGVELPIPENEKDFALRLNKMAGIEQQRAMIDELDKASYYIERNANAKMLFHALTIRLYHIIADKSLILTT